MEVLLEIVLFFVELLFEFFGETLLEGLTRTKGPGWRPSTPVAVLIALGLGLVVGGMTLTIAPAHFIHDERLRLANLVLAPVLGWAVAALFVRRKKKRGELPLPLERGALGAIVAFGVALVRWLGAA